MIVELDEGRKYSLLQSAQCFSLEKPLRLVELALKTDLVGDLRTNGAFGARVERLPHLSVLVRSYRLYLNQLSRAVRLAPEV